LVISGQFVQKEDKFVQKGIRDSANFLNQSIPEAGAGEEEEL